MSASPVRARLVLLALCTMFTLGSSCDIGGLIGLTGVDPTQQRAYLFPDRAPETGTFTLDAAEDFSASPKSPTTIELIVFSDEPLDLGDEGADFTAKAVLTTWGGTPIEYPITVQRTAFNDPQQDGIVQITGLEGPVLKYRYAGTLSKACPTCVGEAGQALPALWTVSGTYSTVVTISGRCNFTYEPYLGPLVTP